MNSCQDFRETLQEKSLFVVSASPIFASHEKLFKLIRENERKIAPYNGYSILPFCKVYYFSVSFSLLALTKCQKIKDFSWASQLSNYQVLQLNFGGGSYEAKPVCSFHENE